MQYISDFAAGFMKLFQTGGKTFISWMTNIVPVVLLLLVLMNTIIENSKKPHILCEYCHAMGNGPGKNASNGLPKKQVVMC